MQNEVIVEGPTVEEALDAALEELGVQQDAVDFEVVEEPAKSRLGIGGRPAKVRVWLRQEFLAQLGDGEEAPGDDEAVPVSDPRVTPEVSEDELDAIADEAVSAIRRILEGFGITASVDEYEGDDEELILDMTGEDLAVLIGRHGRTLDAFQTLVGAITHKSTGLRYPVVVDVEGYRHRRKAKLEDIARGAAERANKQKRAVELRPMTSYERKVIHMALRDDKRVVTGSQGEEPFRHVVVSPR